MHVKSHISVDAMSKMLFGGKFYDAFFCAVTFDKRVYLMKLLNFGIV